MIDEWKNVLNDLVFFVKLDHNDSYKPFSYRFNQRRTLLVLAHDFFPPNFSFDFYKYYFCWYGPNLFPKASNDLFFLAKELSSKNLEAVRVRVYTCYGPYQTHTSIFVFHGNAIIYSTLPWLFFYQFTGSSGGIRGKIQDTMLWWW